MWILLLGLTLFVIPHVLKELGLRETMIRLAPSMGAYKAIYSVVVLGGLALVIVGKSQSPFIMVFAPIFELRYLSNVMMIPATLLVVAGNLPMGRLRKAVRNPMLLGVCLWGIAHLWSNGDVASVLLFATFTVWAGIKFVVKAMTEQPPAQEASIIWDIVAMVIGLMLYALITIYHGQLFGIGLINV